MRQSPALRHACAPRPHHTSAPTAGPAGGPALRTCLPPCVRVSRPSHPAGLAPAERYVGFARVPPARPRLQARAPCVFVLDPRAVPPSQPPPTRSATPRTNIAFPGCKFCRNERSGEPRAAGGEQRVLRRATSGRRRAPSATWRAPCPGAEPARPAAGLVRARLAGPPPGDPVPRRRVRVPVGRLGVHPAECRTGARGHRDSAADRHDQASDPGRRDDARQFVPA